MYTGLSIISMAGSVSTTKYISFNVKGVNHAIKRKKLFSCLKKEKASPVTGNLF